jgi:multicomponent K+:H+ antiporter subunit C
MEVLFATAVGVLTAVGVYLMLRLRSFPVIVGLTMLTYAVNLFLFASGRLMLHSAPVLSEPGPYSDPLPQALVLTAIVIAFGMSALVVILALGAYLSSGTDEIDMTGEPEAAPGEAEGGPRA